MGANHWQPWENLFLHEVAGQMPVSLIAEKLERSERAVYTGCSPRCEIPSQHQPQEMDQSRVVSVWPVLSRGNRRGNRPIYLLRAQQAQLTCPIVRR